MFRHHILANVTSDSKTQSQDAIIWPENAFAWILVIKRVAEMEEGENIARRLSQPCPVTSQCLRYIVMTLG
jgi:apolipoprotein N-acyltransferase